MEAGIGVVGFNNEAILNSLADGVVVIGADRRVLLVNRAAREILGRVGEEGLFCGDKCSEIKGVPGCSLGCLVNATIRTGEHIYNYETVIGKGDRQTTISINTALVRDESGNIIGGVEIFRDISIIKRLEGELKDKYSFHKVVGKNYKMHEVYELLHEVAPTRATVLIEGESGTGKELIANAIHHNSPRSRKPFIKVNCAALSEGLLESELFGHVKGSFTGAIVDKPGRFELADNGTIFLDEIGDITPHTQVKLLRALQEGEFERVGGTKTIKVDVRVIAATNKDLKVAIEKGDFREDLYYRLKVVPIALPPLRERRDDVPHLVRHFIDKFNGAMQKEITNISPRALDLLMDYSYPGNIRELEHILEHAFVRCQGKTILPEHLPKEFQHSDIIDKAMDSEDPLKELERETVLRALHEVDWRYLDAAKRLKISRSTLWRKIKELNIEKR